ncbi:MAG: Chaperone SurA precursor [Bacteroidetes bacterium ADurb.Bin217]|nr:MAG: Chaperone SurA precursor [Bacteroidetes bacterium ADurb.Bin217]HOS84080.1 peptidylprolyl isomerase [Bacteroidales bacterium]
MKKQFVSLVCIVLIGFSYINAQTIQIPDSIKQKVLLTVDTASITADEFAWFYNKYNSYLDSSLIVSIEESMQLFIDYKMKIIDAERQKLDTTDKFKDEFYSYLKSTAKSYLYNDTLEHLAKVQAYERLQTDYNISHIFIRSNVYSNPKDTLAAYKKALSLKKELEAGADFGKYAQLYSDDTFTKEYGGNLGYITSMILPLPYEHAVYASKKGSIIGPIRTEQGYYITKINDIRPTKGQVKASLIVIYHDSKHADSVRKAKLIADTVYNRLLAGESFDTLSNIYNLNQRLYSSKGDIGWLDNSMRYDPPLKEALFAMQQIGDITKPLYFDYGVVIAQLTGKSELADIKSYVKTINKLFKKDETRKNVVKEAFYAEYKKTAPYKQQSQTIANFISLVDNSILLGKWTKPSFTENKTLFTIGKESYTYEDFSQYLFENQKSKHISDKEVLVRMRLQEYVNNMLEQHAVQHLHLRNQEFARIMQEYHDGMIIYELMNNEVFQKANKDSAAVYQWYIAHPQDYLQTEGIRVSYFMCKDAKIAKKVVSLIQKPQSSFTDQSIVTTINKKSMDNVLLDSAVFYRGQDSFVDSLEWKTGSYHILENNKVMRITKHIPVQPMPFETCKNAVISDYQSYLEDVWVQSLRKKYSYSLNQSYFSLILAKNSQ